MQYCLVVIINVTLLKLAFFIAEGKLGGRKKRTKRPSDGAGGQEIGSDETESDLPPSNGAGSGDQGTESDPYPSDRGSGCKQTFVLFVFVFDGILFVLTAKCENGECCHRLARKWISCDHCEQWFHCVCVNISSKRAQNMDFLCKVCLILH